MEEVEHEPQFYISSDKLSLLQCSKYVPNILYDFVNWCVSLSAFRKAQTCNEDPALNYNLNVLTFCHDLIQGWGTSQNYLVRPAMALQEPYYYVHYSLAAALF